MSFTPKPHKLKVFESAPPANEETFLAGIPSKSTAESALSIILFSPNMQSLGSMDNTDSPASSTLAIAVTHGFKFSMSQTISFEETLGINIEIVTDQIKMGFSITFTEEWSTETTVTRTFTCPAGQLAFIYQGTLVFQILKLDAQSGQFSWLGSAGTAGTEAIKTTGTPIVAPNPNVKIIDS